jgi:hypothetical protein
MEANNEQQKPLLDESAPNIHSHTIKDPTADKNLGDVAPASAPRSCQMV